MIDLSKAPPVNEADVAELMMCPPPNIDVRCKNAKKDLETTVRTFLAFVPEWRIYHTDDTIATMSAIIQRSDEENQRLLDLKWRNRTTEVGRKGQSPI